MKVNQGKMTAKLGAHHDTLMARMNFQLEKMESYLEKMDSTDLEVNRGKSGAVAEHAEAPKEDAAVENIRALEQRCGDRHLAVGCRRKLKKRAQVNGGSWKKPAAARR
jgi:hypothetical protein